MANIFIPGMGRDPTEDGDDQSFFPKPPFSFPTDIEDTYVHNGAPWPAPHQNNPEIDMFPFDPPPITYQGPFPNNPQQVTQVSTSLTPPMDPVVVPIHGPVVVSRSPSPGFPDFPNYVSDLPVPPAPTSARSVSRSPSPNFQDLRRYGTFDEDSQTWRCAYPGCNSKAVFLRPCDLRKHYHRHTKSYFCRHDGCPQATQGGFSSNKDRLRHEASHNPGVQCEWKGCDRIFSRVDNMKDHLRRIHYKKA